MGGFRMKRGLIFLMASMGMIVNICCLGLSFSWEFSLVSPMKMCVRDAIEIAKRKLPGDGIGMVFTSAVAGRPLDGKEYWMVCFEDLKKGGQSDPVKKYIVDVYEDGVATVNWSGVEHPKWNSIDGISLIDCFSATGGSVSDITYIGSVPEAKEWCLRTLDDNYTASWNERDGWQISLCNSSSELHLITGVHRPTDVHSLKTLELDVDFAGAYALLERFVCDDIELGIRDLNCISMISHDISCNYSWEATFTGKDRFVVLRLKEGTWSLKAEKGARYNYRHYKPDVRIIDAFRDFETNVVGHDDIMGIRWNDSCSYWVVVCRDGEYIGMSGQWARAKSYSEELCPSGIIEKCGLYPEDEIQVKIDL